MNKHPTIRPVLGLLLLAAGLFLANVTASAADAGKSAPRNPDGTLMIPAETLLAEIKTTPYSGRSALKAKIQDAEARFSARLPEWEARKNNLPEKDGKKVYRVRMREVLRQKIDSVESAEEATWNSAKQDLYSSMLNTIQIFKKLQAQFDA